MQRKSWYERHVLPNLVDVACGLSTIARQRQKVVPRAAGRMLEIGIGTGRNLPLCRRAHAIIHGCRRTLVPEPRQRERLRRTWRRMEGFPGLSGA